VGGNDKKISKESPMSIMGVKMKMFLVILCLISFSSCKDDLKQNYQFVRLALESPDSLYSFISNSENTTDYYKKSLIDISIDFKTACQIESRNLGDYIKKYFSNKYDILYDKEAKYFENTKFTGSLHILIIKSEKFDQCIQFAFFVKKFQKDWKLDYIIHYNSRE
jgi:hypothetical protein